MKGGAFGVESMEYQGAHPVSKLTIEPSAEGVASAFLQQSTNAKANANANAKAHANAKANAKAKANSNVGTIDLSANLYGFSTMKVGDRPASARPAIAFTLDLHNSGTEAAPVGFMFNMPLLIEEDQVGTTVLQYYWRRQHCCCSCCGGLVNTQRLHF